MQQHQFKPSRKNGWDEHRLVILANPPTRTQRSRVGRDGDVGMGDLHRRRVGCAHRPRAGGPPLAALTPACAPSLGCPVTAIPSVGDSVKNKADDFFLDKDRLAPVIQGLRTGPAQKREPPAR